MSSHRKYTWIFVLCSSALLVLIFLMPSYGWSLRQFLSPARTLSADDPTVIAQNQVLQAELAQAQSIISQEPQAPSNYLRAMVYSEYPFGFKNEVLVNVGSNEGVLVGKAVIFQGIFIGSIEKAFPDSAVIQTVFDPAFKMPVRIGNAGYDGLLVGGADPKAASIAKNMPVQNSDIVYTADAGFPYGLPIATVDATSTSADNLFQEASLNFAYDVNGIQAVLIER